MSETNVNKSEIIVALDIGTTKICAIAGRRDQHGKIEVLGFGKVASEGVLRGVVSNIEKTVKAIAEAVNMAQRTAGQTFKVVHVGIAGQHIKSLQHRGILTRDSDHTEISRRDIDRLISDMFKLVLPPGDKILHVIPQEYTVDNEQGITDPIGMSGIRLEANFHIITGQISASNNIHRCVERTGLKVANMTLEPIASASAVLSEEEKEAGVALVDIGGGTTDITIFQEGIIRHTAVIPFGGNVITKDIKEGCTVMKPQAEKLKVRFGSALAEEVYDNRIISIPGLRGQDHKEISEKNLARIIQARVEEILDYVIWEVRRSGFERKLIGGIVLTGGGALLNHIDKLSEYHTGMSTRIGTPVEHLAHGYHEQLSSPIYSTGVGLLIKGLDDLEAGLIPAQTVETKDDEETVMEKEPVGNWYDHLFKRTKEWFEAEPDNEF
ncbi:cell division protein FtsA [Phaeodactylibacter sp.]|uniref:cell division protein FtsA n=1 Tax=Phaeodactylibacter sp. TaxID=1940289 RepID=UPI0032EDAE2C